ncbi:phosphoribosylamine--glycine ligase [mine drainage metagenome]|uniref:phosphoribosylamine--glycine ligase n=1 Tax=mine drainage metagenome TaxID=410659 RepID=T0ZKE1_9ZZZZ
MSIKVLLVGGGGREDALGRLIVQSGSELITAMSNTNPSLSSISSKVIKLDENDPIRSVPNMLSEKPDVAYIGPDGLLNTDLADKLFSNGIKIASPGKKAFQIESSKGYMRNLMKRNSIPGIIPYYLMDDDYNIEKILNTGIKYAIKPLGLTGGKGVKVMNDQLPDIKSALSYARSILRKDKQVLLEEKIEGHEFSVQAFCDGKRLIAMPVAQDYKRAFEGDLGPNTGGMGSISDANHSLPFLREGIVNQAIKIMKKINDSMEKEGNKFRGILYGQFMQTSNNLYMIEMNARFADPEGMNVLSLFRGNIVDVLFGIANEDLSTVSGVSFQQKSTVLKYIVPKGYGEKPLPGQLKIDMKDIPEELTLYYSSVNGEMDNFTMTSSRALAVLARSATIERASATVEENLWRIKGDYHIRHDIGTSESMEKKMNMYL